MAGGPTSERQLTQTQGHSRHGPEVPDTSAGDRPPTAVLRHLMTQGTGAGRRASPTISCTIASVRRNPSPHRDFGACVTE